MKIQELIPHLHKTIHHPFPPGMFEVDFELVAFDLDDGAVAEFLVEDALAERDVAAALVAEADGAAAVFLWRVEAAGAGAVGATGAAVCGGGEAGGEAGGASGAAPLRCA